MADGGCIGGTYGVDAMSLARHISDMAQYLTAKLGSHGGKDIAKVMAITNGSAKRGS